MSVKEMTFMNICCDSVWDLVRPVSSRVWFWSDSVIELLNLWLTSSTTGSHQTQLWAGCWRRACVFVTLMMMKQWPVLGTTHETDPPVRMWPLIDMKNKYNKYENFTQTACFCPNFRVQVKLFQIKVNHTKSRKHPEAALGQTQESPREPKRTCLVGSDHTWPQASSRIHSAQTVDLWHRLEIHSSDRRWCL